MLTASGTRWAARCLCAALLGAGAAGTAGAAVNAQLNLEDFGWTLVDLRPGDGIAPGVTFDDSRFNSRLVASAQQTMTDANGRPLPYSSDLRDRYIGKGVLFPWQQVAAGTATSGAYARQSGYLGSNDYGFELVGRAANAFEGHEAYLSRFDARTVPASSSFAGAIVLAPYTALVWTGQLSMRLEKSGHGGQTVYERAVSAFSLRMLDAEGRRVGGSFVRLDTQGHADGVLEHDQALRFSMINRSGTALAGTLEGSLRVGGYTAMNPVFAPAVAAVPEPGAVGLMLAGVGVVGMAARRRRRGVGAGAPCGQ